jgi:His-Xaa-Ser repeat protein HxsA
MASKGKFAIPTLLAAGMTPLAAGAGDVARAPAQEQDSLWSSIKKMVSNISETHKFTLAAHGSHGSHGSHSSHRSSGSRLIPGDGNQTETASADTRNMRSTPPNSVLPGSPAIAKKLKVLPGNSGKFKDIVTQAQIALLVRGYESGEVSGELHARSVAAIYRYQADHGFVPSGKLTGEVLASLGITAK